jgi:hypothetical protein
VEIQVIDYEGEASEDMEKESGAQYNCDASW